MDLLGRHQREVCEPFLHQSCLLEGAKTRHGLLSLHGYINPRKTTDEARGHSCNGIKGREGFDILQEGFSNR